MFNTMNFLRKVHAIENLKKYKIITTATIVTPEPAIL